jgi:hypothetical protein
MKRKKLKLDLNKFSISSLRNLESIRGGNETYSEDVTCIVSLTYAIEICCKNTGGDTNGGF